MRDTALIFVSAFLKTSERKTVFILIADEKLIESYEEISKDGNYSFCIFEPYFLKRPKY
ncbi:hypothetical protein [Brachyspira hyodysenteriae]|uniref:hypothetical protein n=1 Tax=Brachyspira hyodysenteriae TaxID=159 RepID=UPI0022CD3186|nr:hypothetical protein [Brachyspira hyodysenteriae]MCZ9896267.1 hypothetical protein [Brachyspira hyodysenteriae]